MKLYSENDNYKLYQGDMLDMLDVIKKESIDAVLTDPPYELNFMGKGWDNSGIAFQPSTWQKCYEVLKPGGYLLAFGGSRTFHRIACAIEDAGFEIRDTIMWLYGSGFPKSMDISKQIDKKGGNDYSKQFAIDLKQARESRNLTMKYCDDKYCNGSTNWSWYEGRKDGCRVPDYQTYLEIIKEFPELEKYRELIKEAEREVIGKKESGCFNNQEKDRYTIGSSKSLEVDITIPNTDLAKQWNGWGTALKPSFEPIIVARKPFKGSLVDNVIEYGVGGINVDECRVGNEELHNSYAGNKNSGFTNADERDAKGKGMFSGIKKGETIVNGRFPANTILTYDDTDFDEVCGGFPDTKGNGNIRHNNNNGKNYNCYSNYGNCDTKGYEDSGSASRYFMNCKYTGKDEEIWKQLLVNNVENNLEILKATKDNIAQMNVEDLLKELKDHYAKYVDNQLDLIETPIVQDIVEMLTWDFKIGTSQVIQDFIINSKKCIQFLNLVQFVEKMDNIDTTQTTQNLLKLFGYVKVVITNYIQGNIEYDQKRYIYAPKASKKDRDEGLEEFEEKYIPLNNQATAELKRGNVDFEGKSAFCKIQLKKNTHPTVKPTELMQYLVRLVSPDGATILDPFNGSGSTGKAVMYENREKNKNYKYIGIELTEEYLPIAKARIEYVCNLEPEKDNQLTIFDFIGEE